MSSLGGEKRNLVSNLRVGLGLSIFGSVLQEIFYFKPQTIFVSLVFLTVWAYILGDLMAILIPREIDWKIGGLRITDGGILRFLNPGPFNSKEHAVCCEGKEIHLIFIVIIC